MQHALLSGVVGAAALTGLHEAGRHLASDAPRMDVLGKRALRKLTGRRPSYWQNVAADVLTNAAYYGAFLLGDVKRPFSRTLTAGVLAGAGALLVPQHIGLGRAPRSRKPANRIMTVAWYAIGALVAATVYRTLKDGEFDPTINFD